MPNDDVLERDLRALLEVDSPSWLESVVRARVGAASAHQGLGRLSGSPRAHRYVLVAALLILAVAACTVAIDRLAPFGRGGSVEVGRGTPLDLTAEASGWRLSLVNAYADANRLTLFLFAEPLEGEAGTTFVEAREVIVRDELGREFLTAGSAHAAFHAGRSAQEISFAPPDQGLTAGEHLLTARVEGLTVGREVPSGEPDYQRVAGPWTFEFEVASQGGTLLEPGTRAVHEGVTITLDRLSVSPSMVRAWLSVENAPAGAEWMPVLLVDRGPKHWEGHGDGLGTGGTGSVSVDLGGGGIDDPTGAWSVEVYSLVERDEEQDVTLREIPGPWDLSFEVSEP